MSSEDISSEVSMSMQVMTKTKMFLTQSPGIMTQTEDGHKVSMEKRPTVIVNKNGEFRTTKALVEPSVVTENLKESTDFTTEKSPDSFQVNAETYTTEQTTEGRPTTEPATTEHGILSLTEDHDINENLIHKEIESSKGVPSLSPVVEKPFTTSAYPTLGGEGLESTKTYPFTEINTQLYNTVDMYPTGLVASIGGYIADISSQTTRFQTLIFGTFIEEKYAHVVKGNEYPASFI